MRAIDFTFRLFGWIFQLTFDMYPMVIKTEKHTYGSTSNFGKWKTAPHGLPVNPYNLTKKRKKKK